MEKMKTLTISNDDGDFPFKLIDNEAVHFTEQTLTEEQQAQARANIGAAAEGTGEAGADGFSPIANVTQTSTGAVIRITDKSGTTSATVTNGNDGADGENGTSPTISVSAITGGHRITITDVNVIQTVDVMDGDPGADGAPGEDGEDGNGIASVVLNADYTLTFTFDDGTSYTTPSIRGATGATGSAGKDGNDGADGVSPTVTVSKANGVTTITIKDANGTKTATINDGATGASVTVSSVTESTEDGGSNVVNFSDGKSVTIKNGKTGGKGADGYTPVAGKDYYTSADKAEFETLISEEFAKRGQLEPEFANSIEECTDTTKLYVLPDGYIYAYLPSSKPKYTNVIDEVGYSEDVRISTSSNYTETPQPGYDLTGYVRLKVGDVVRMRNISIPNTTTGYDSTFYCFDVDKNGLGKGNLGYLEQNGANPVWENGNLTQFTVIKWLFGGSTTEGYIRFGAGNVDDTSILTINEEITEGSGGGYAWASTGHAFVPADYEDRIVALENKATAQNTTNANFEERISAVEKYDIAGLPDYAIAERDRVRDTLYEKLTLGNVTIIGFSTDQHISKWTDMEETCNTQGTLAGLRAMKSLTNKIPFNAVVLGGDYVTGGSVQSIQTETAMVFEQLAGAECPVVGTTGNHDSWQNDSTVTDGDIFKTHTAHAVVKYPRFVNLDTISANGYIDDPSVSLRYIILDAEPRDAGSTNLKTTITANLTAMLNSMPSGYKAVIFSHKPLNDSLGDNFKDEVDNKSVLESNKSKIICCVNGHGHLDAAATSNGVLYIQTTCAGIDRPNDAYDRTVGTADETVFDVFVIDQTNRRIYAVRYGAGNDREFSY